MPHAGLARCASLGVGAATGHLTACGAELAPRGTHLRHPPERLFEHRWPRAAPWQLSVHAARRSARASAPAQQRPQCAGALYDSPARSARPCWRPCVSRDAARGCVRRSPENAIPRQQVPEAPVFHPGRCCSSSTDPPGAARRGTTRCLALPREPLCISGSVDERADGALGQGSLSPRGSVLWPARVSPVPARRPQLAGRPPPPTSQRMVDPNHKGGAQYCIAAWRCQSRARPAGALAAARFAEVSTAWKPQHNALGASLAPFFQTQTVELNARRAPRAAGRRAWRVACHRLMSRTRCICGRRLAGTRAR